MVEGRWRNLVTLYKTMIDHNSMPNIEPQVVAYKEDLEELVKYAPQRRNNYEKRVGRSVKLGKEIVHAVFITSPCHQSHVEYEHHITASVICCAGRLTRLNNIFAERFPSSGCRILLQAYKDCMSRFMDPKIDNRILWDEITKVIYCKSKMHLMKVT